MSTDEVYGEQKADEVRGWVLERPLGQRPGGRAAEPYKPVCGNEGGGGVHREGISALVPPSRYRDSLEQRVRSSSISGEGDSEVHQSGGEGSSYVGVGRECDAQDHSWHGKESPYLLVCEGCGKGV